MYSSDLHIFLSPDPSGQLTAESDGQISDANLYRAFANDPINNIDPTGLAAEPVAAAEDNWHHLLSKSVFDPANQNSALNRAKLKLEEGIDPHSAEWGWMINSEDHSVLHSNANELEKRWEAEQKLWLEKLAKKGVPDNTVTRKMLVKHVAEMKEAYGLTNNGVVKVGSQATEQWRGITSYYNELATKERLIAKNITAPERVSADVAKLISSSTWKKLAARAAGRGVKVVVGVGAVTMAISGFNEARASGASPSAALAVGIIESVNPLPWSTVEIKDKLNEDADGILQWTNEVNDANHDGRKNGLEFDPWKFAGVGR